MVLGSGRGDALLQKYAYAVLSDSAPSRYLSGLREIAGEQNSTIAFSLPELVTALAPNKFT